MYDTNLHANNENDAISRSKPSARSRTEIAKTITKRLLIDVKSRYNVLDVRINVGRVKRERLSRFPIPPKMKYTISTYRLIVSLTSDIDGN